MLRLILRRVLISIPLILVVTFITFLLQSLAPGDTARAILGLNYTPEAYARLVQELGLDRPLLVRYADWLGSAVLGDLGTSPVSGLSVAGEIGHRLGVTISLMIGTTAVALILGVALGVVSAVRGGWLGKLVDVVSLAGFSLPNFWLGLVFVTVFAVLLRWLPATGYVSISSSPTKWIVALILPVATLAAGAIAIVAKQTRDSMRESLGRPFILALRANGVPRSSIILRHSLRNAAIPIVTVLGLMFVGLSSGTVLIEAVFAMPGLGGLAVQATTQRDVPMIQGVALTFTLIVVLVNLVVDLAYGWLNPKVRVA